MGVTTVACAVWSIVITLEYYFAGHVILGAPTWLQITLIIVGIVATIASFKLLKPGLPTAPKSPAKPADAADQV
jgi:hypothetical protein